MGESGQATIPASSGTLRCAFVGDEPLVEQCAELARAEGLDVVLIATTNQMVRDYALAQGIAVVGPDELAAGLDEKPADVLFSVANLRVLPDAVLDRVSTAINFHDGPLPGYAGLNVTTWALLNGEREHGITWHMMTSAVDAGEIVTTETFPISDDETAFSLNARCYEAALASFPRVAAAVAGRALATTPQPDGEHRMFRRHDRPAVVLDPAAPAETSARSVRALDFGHRLRNPIGSARLVLDGEAYVVDSARRLDPTDGSRPGVLVALDADGARIATADGDLLITAISTPEGRPVELSQLAARHGLSVGGVVPSPPQELVAAIAELEPQLARDEVFWHNRLSTVEPTSLAGVTSDGTTVVTRTSRTLPEGADDRAATTALAVWLSRVTSTPDVCFGVTDPRTRAVLDRIAPLALPALASLTIRPEATFAEVHDVVREELATLAPRNPILRDAIGRDPATRGRDFTSPVMLELDVPDEPADSDTPTPMLRIALGAGRLHVRAAAAATDTGYADRVADQLVTVLDAGLRAPDTPVGELPLIGAAELALLDAINNTAVDHDRTATIDQLFHAQAARTPDAPALSSGRRTYTYRELESEVDALAGRLAGLGVGRGDRVGIAVPRGAAMLIGVLATLERGAAYVPLDPTYPIERLQFMVDDAGIAVLLATEATAAQLGRPDVPVLDPSAPGSGPATVAPSRHEATDLAYVIYTSGSTGKPKGVMLEHRQVTNFFAAMDRVIEHDPPGVWLAVTSLSFDISVLELLWTLTRGFHVVLKSDRGVAAVTPTVSRAAPPRPVTLSLFYFAAGEDAAADGYRLLLESARFADRHGFEAVWTPERHFHAFGGSYPNPSVTGAALAAVTTNVGIRAGSVVLPIHSPIRVAEEWAVVDNLSRGRVAISFAAGWQPNDFVLNPSAYATAKDDLPRSIETVKRLWRGESVTLPGHDGAPVEVRTLPRPVQSELPIWLTSAGSPATFERAGKMGVNVLTHLLGQSIEQLGENIARYRAAWREAGHAGDGRVTLMLHTYLDRDSALAREVAREPMKSYLGTAVGLLRDVASTFPTFAGRGKGTDDLFKSLSPEEMDQLLEMAAQRYLGTSGLFGTPEEAASIIEDVSAAGADEVACLIDFGIDTDNVLRSLELLLEAKAIVDSHRESAAGRQPADHSEDVPVEEDTVAALVAKHGVTHLQCTPSLAAMLVADPADRAALGSIHHLMLGGEALPAALATELRALLPGRFTNMYGPTETTIWSLTHELTDVPGKQVPIGTPIANTTIFVLDPEGRRLPIGAFGELHIGGEGVARGYHNRPELTAERFVDRPGIGRVYATGDIVRIHPAGYVEFAGRSDNQVKIRGHRIELGEIESVLDRHPDVVQSVVVAREERGDTKLVAFVVTHAGADVTPDALRKYVAEILPDVMVPAAVSRLDALPLTPNGKIDRKALPTDTEFVSSDVPISTTPPAGDTERLVAEIWSAELERPVGRDDNFFDIGGHSLLAVKVFRRLSDATGAPLALTDVFRYPTVRAFAAHLANLQGGGTESTPTAPAASAPSATDRGAMRRRALARRGGQDGSP